MRSPTALRGLESSGLRVNIAKSDGAGVPAGLRGVELELVGDDRVGIVSNLTRMLAARGISIENIHTEIVGARDRRQADVQGRRAPAGAGRAVVRRPAARARRARPTR